MNGGIRMDYSPGAFNRIFLAIWSRINEGRTTPTLIQKYYIPTFVWDEVSKNQKAEGIMHCHIVVSSSLVLWGCRGSLFIVYFAYSLLKLTWNLREEQHSSAIILKEKYEKFREFFSILPWESPQTRAR